MRRRTDFDRVFQQGRHNGGRLLTLRSVANGLDITRRGFAIPRRVGKAVVRNRVRRRLREALRSLPVREGFDIVITVRPEAAAAGYEQLRQELMLLLKRARLLLPASPEC